MQKPPEQAAPTSNTSAETDHAGARRTDHEGNLRDLAYGSAAEQRLDVYVPAGAEGAPVLFMVHGGAWMMGDKRNSGVVDNKRSHWLARRFIFVSTNYRLRPPDPLRQASDVADALAYVQSHAREWGGDPQRILVIGHSSGAHLAALLASNPALTQAHGVEPWRATIAIDSAAYDVARIMRRRHMGFYDRVFKDDPAFWKAASPLHTLTEKPAPFLAVCSSQRRDDSCEQARAFVEKVTSLGGRAELLPISKSHAALNEDLGRPEPYTEAVDAFIDSLGT